MWRAYATCATILKICIVIRIFFLLYKRYLFEFRIIWNNGNCCVQHQLIFRSNFPFRNLQLWYCFSVKKHFGSMFKIKAIKFSLLFKKWTNNRKRSCLENINFVNVKKIFLHGLQSPWLSNAETLLRRLVK